VGSEGRVSSRSEAHGAARGRAFWLGGRDLERWTALQLRDSAGLAPDFPRLVALFGCAGSIGRRLHCARVRIVSLLPSATEIVCLLGLEEQLVGVSADSDWPVDVVKRLPVLNTVSIDTDQMTSAEIDAAASDGHRGASLYHVNPDLLRALRPDLILTQEICEVCAVSRGDVELASRTLGYAPHVLSLSPVTLDQVVEDIDLVARTAGIADHSVDVVNELRARLDLVRARTAGIPRPRVFCLEWLDPPYTAGHWVPEMVNLAGGCDELGTPAGPSRRVAWEDVVGYAPEVIVLMPCSLELERVAREFDVVRSLPGWAQLPAVQTRQVYAGHTHLFSRPGPRLVDGVETLARMLHPEAFSEPIPLHQALKVTFDGQRLEPYQ
jgi:iron complex transport system substrate-binding protein